MSGAPGGEGEAPARGAGARARAVASAAVLAARRPRLLGSLLPLLARIPERHGDKPLDDGEEEIVDRFLKARERVVGDFLVPRARVVSVDAGAPRGEILDLLRRCGHSRLPVHEGRLDDALGILFAKDLLLRGGAGGPDEPLPRAILRPAPSVPESMGAIELLETMRRERSHMALVADDHGGVEGLVTLEDAVEELLGDFSDEHDSDPGPEHRRLPDGSIRADGGIRIGDLAELLAARGGGPGEEEGGLALSEAEVDALLAAAEEAGVDTLGGLAANLADGAPPPGGFASLPGAGLRFVVLESRPPLRVLSLRIERAGPEAGEAPARGAEARARRAP